MPSPASGTSEPPTPSLHDALPIWARGTRRRRPPRPGSRGPPPPRPGRGRGACRTTPRSRRRPPARPAGGTRRSRRRRCRPPRWSRRSEEHTSELQSPCKLVCRRPLPAPPSPPRLPYTTLFRSGHEARGVVDHLDRDPVALRHRGQVEAVGRAEQRLEVVDGPRHGLREEREDPAAVVVDHHDGRGDRKSTRLNSSHLVNSYAVARFRHLRAPHAFPTRRSSDLGTRHAASSTTSTGIPWPSATAARSRPWGVPNNASKSSTAPGSACGRNAKIPPPSLSTTTMVAEIGRAHV